MPANAQSIDKIKTKIAMLLAKAESTTFPEERDTFNAAAEKLMLRLGIARAELESVGKAGPEKVVQVKREYSGIFAIAWISSGSAIARGFGNVTPLQSSVNRGRLRWLYLVGVESDIADLSQLIDSVDAQALAALAAWRRETKDVRSTLTAMEKELRDRSFIEGFGGQVGRRLAETRKVEEAGVAGTGTELVLRSKKQRVDEWLENEYGKLRAVHSKRGHDWQGAQAGRAAGAKADIGSKKLGARGRIGS